MEPSDSWVTYWWAILPIAALLYFAYATWKRGASRPAQAAFASVTLGVAGLLFCPLAPLAIYFGRKASRAGSQMDGTISMMSRVGVVLGIIGSVFLALVVLMASIYFYVWLTDQYLFRPAKS